MAAPAIVLPVEREHGREPAWVIGPAADLVFLIGGALVSFGLLGAHLFLGVPAVALYTAWVLAVDGPHVFATLSRTYLDREERAARTGLLRWSLCFFALGPLSVGLSLMAGGRLPYDAFLVLCSLWAYWHVVRQHYGVMVLYKRKARDEDRADEAVDRITLYAGLLAPFVSFALTSPRSPATMGVIGSPPAWVQAAAIGSWWVWGAALLVLAGRQASLLIGGRPLNRTKLLFLAAALSVSAVLFSPGVTARVEYEAVFPIVTSFHNVQYLAIVWFFHRNRRGSRPRRRPAPAFTTSLLAFLGAGFAFTLAYRVLLGCAFSAWPGCDVGAQDVALSANLTASDLGVAFLWGFALHHYYLDQKIWRVRHDTAVSRDLRLGDARSA